MKRFRVLAAIVALVASVALGDAAAQQTALATRIDNTMLIRQLEPTPTYRMTAFRSYGRVRINFEGANVSANCDGSPLTSFLRQLLVSGSKSAGIAVRVTTDSVSSDAGSEAAAPANPGSLASTSATVLFVGNLLRVSRQEGFGFGSRCRTQVDTAGVRTPLLDLRGQARAVRVEFLVWTSTERSPGFIPNTAIDLYSVKALAPLTREQARTYATELIGMFDRASDALPSRTLNFEPQPPEYGVSLVLDPNDTLARGARVDVELETTRSMFWDAGTGEADYTDISAGDVLETRIAPNLTVRGAIEQIPGDTYSKWSRPSTSNIADFEEGCAAIEQRVSSVGLTGEDQVVARWALAATNPAIRQAPADFASTTCLGGLRAQLERLGPRQPTAFRIPAGEPPVPPPVARPPIVDEINQFVRTKFRPYTRTPPDDDRGALRDDVFVEHPQITVSGLLPAVTPALADENSLTGEFGRLGCLVFTAYREELNIPGSRLEGVIELGGGAQSYIRAYFEPALPGGPLHIAVLEFNAQAPDLAKQRIRDRYGDQCENGWRPNLIYGPS